MAGHILLRKPAGRPYVFINGTLPDDARKALDRELSYPVQNPEYAQAGLASKHAKENDARKARGEAMIEYPPWDGRIHFLHKAKSGSYFFPAGLTKRVKEFLKWYEIDAYEDLHYSEDRSSGKFEWAGPELREYQKQAITKLIAHDGGIVSLPTGSGKTLIALRMIYALHTQTIVLVHTKELFGQWKREIEKTLNMVPISYSEAICGFIPADYAGDRNKDDWAGVTLAMIPTLAQANKTGNMIALRTLEKKYNVLCVDEIHHLPCNTFYSVAMKIDAKYRLGFSATLHREDGEDMKMEAGIGPTVAHMEAGDLIESGYLSRPIFEFIEVPATNITGKTFSQIYSSGIVNNEKRNFAIANRVKKLVDEGRQVYIHVEHINHGKILAGIIKCPFVYSKSKDRDETIDTFRKGLTRVICSTLMGEGVDIPSISAIVMAGGRKTEIGTIQKVGRALRPDVNFDTAIVVDFADKGKYLSQHSLKRYQSYIGVYGEDVVRRRE